MGRMLETLKQGEGRRVMATVEKPTTDTAVQECVVDWEIGEEVPYVEVGGPNKKVELSPGLQVHPAQTAPRPPHHTIEVLPAAKTVQLTRLQPMAVSYEAWPGPMPTPLSVSPDVIAYHQPDHPTSKQYGVLLETMLQGLKGTGTRVVLLLSLRPNVGASTVILNLATIAAQQKKMRVALVEACRENAGLARGLGRSAATGLSDVLTGAVGLEQALVRTGIDALDLLPTGLKQAPIATEAMTWLVACLRERYDLVLIDGPASDDAASLAVHAAQANGVYLVLPTGEPKASKDVTHRLASLGGRLDGLIHTHFEV